MLNCYKLTKTVCQERSPISVLTPLHVEYLRQTTLPNKQTVTMVTAGLGEPLAGGRVNLIGVQHPLAKGTDASKFPRLQRI